MKTSRMLAAVLVLVILTGCASTKAYFIDRGRDAMDIVNLGVEWKAWEHRSKLDHS